MKKNSKVFLALFIVSACFVVLHTVLFYTGNSFFGYNDFVKTVVVFSFFSLVGLVGFAETAMYKIVVSGEEILIRTMFKKTSISFANINHYTKKRYSKISSYYQFKLYLIDTGKSIKLYTHNPDKLSNILNDKLQV